MKIDLIKATDDDIPFLIQLREQTMYGELSKAGIDLSEKEQYQRVKAYLDLAWIILKSNQKIGMIKYREMEDVFKIIQFQILPGFQKKGIGGYVLNDLRQKAKLSGKKIKLKVLKNSAAVTFYKQAGFHILAADDYEYVMQN